MPWSDICWQFQAASSCDIDGISTTFGSQLTDADYQAPPSSSCCAVACTTEDPFHGRPPAARCSLNLPYVLWKSPYSLQVSVMNTDRLFLGEMYYLCFKLFPPRRLAIWCRTHINDALAYRWNFHSADKQPWRRDLHHSSPVMQQVDILCMPPLSNMPPALSSSPTCPLPATIQGTFSREVQIAAVTIRLGSLELI